MSDPPLTDEKITELRRWAATGSYGEAMLPVLRSWVFQLLDEHESLCDAHAKLAVDHLVESEAAARRLGLLKEVFCLCLPGMPDEMVDKLAKELAR